MITFKDILKEENIPDVEWNNSISDKDIAAANNYLTLILSTDVVKEIVSKFQRNKQKITYYKAKDLLRASELSELPDDSGGVEHKIELIKKGEALNPVLVVVYDSKLHVADGYHRICTCYKLGENVPVACVRVYVEKKN